MKEPKYKTLGQLLRQYRKEAGLKQKQLAGMLESENISVTFISQIERGWKRPNPKSLHEIAKALHLNHSKTLELLLAADYGMPTEKQLDSSNVMMKTVLAVLEDIPNTQEVISETAKSIFIDQVKQLVKLWGSYSEARALLYDGQMEMAHMRMDNALSIQRRLDSATNAHILDARGEIAYRRGQLDIAREQYSMARDHAKLAGDDMLTGLTTIHLGDIARMDGHWDNALTLYQRAHDIFEKLESPSNIEQAERNAATIHLFRGNWMFLGSALVTGRANKFKQTTNSHILMKNDLLLAWAYSLRGDWQLSLVHRRKALSNALKKKDLQVDAMFAHMFLADGLLQQGDYPGAESNYERANAYFGNNVAEIEKGYVHLGLARVNHAKGPAFWKKADNLFQFSVEMNKQVNFRARYGLSLHYYGRFFVDRYNNSPQAEFSQRAYELFFQAFEIFTALGSPYYRMKALLGLMSMSLSESSLERFYGYADQFIEISRAHEPIHHKLLFQYYLLNAREKINRMELTEGANNYVSAFEHSLQFNATVLQSFQDSLQRSVQQITQSAHTTDICRFLKRFTEGILVVTAMPWYPSLDFERKGKVDWMLHYFGNMLRNLRVSLPMKPINLI